MVIAFPGIEPNSPPIASIRNQDFRQCQALIQRIGTIPSHTFPPSKPGAAHHHELAAKNVQRGLAAKVQELSATFRKKQRVYMESASRRLRLWPPDDR